jgi:hypothetical protein
MARSSGLRWSDEEAVLARLDTCGNLGFVDNDERFAGAAEGEE